MTGDWKSEFDRFTSAEEKQPPAAVKSRIMAVVHADLNPSVVQVFSKILLIHLVVGAVTLLFCPQFGVGLWKDVGIMALLMRYGHHVCMAGCGAIFLGSSALMITLLLPREEMRVLARHRWLDFTGLALLSCVAFVVAGGAIAWTLAAAWLAGSVFGAEVMFDAGRAVRGALARV